MSGFDFGGHISLEIRQPADVKEVPN